MPWGWVIGAVVSAYGSYSSSKEAKKSRRGADSSLQLQRDVYEDLRERYEKHYGPIEEALSAQLQEGADPEGEASRARGEFSRDYDSSLDASRRQQRRYGLDPTTTQAARFEEDAAYNRAAGMADAANRARTEEEDRHFAQSLSFLNGGTGLQSQVAEGYGNQAQLQYGLSNQYIADAAQGAHAAGQYATYGISAYNDRKANTDSGATAGTTTKVGSNINRSAGNKSSSSGATTYPTVRHNAKREEWR